MRLMNAFLFTAQKIHQDKNVGRIRPVVNFFLIRLGKMRFTQDYAAIRCFILPANQQNPDSMKKILTGSGRSCIKGMLRAVLFMLIFM